MAEDWELAGGLINRPKAVEDDDLRAIGGGWEAAALRILGGQLEKAEIEERDI